MIGYITIGTNDLEKSGKYYDELFSVIAAQRIMADDHIILWAKKPGDAMFSVITPHDGKPATVGNGTMASIFVDSLDIVNKLHAKALTLGATDEGLPGPRGETGMCFAYVRDPDGNKMAFYCMAP
jgi:catechol 2,3-dioxygenase-like lactoylglutathione lyase family enzyme